MIRHTRTALAAVLVALAALAGITMPAHAAPSPCCTKASAPKHLSDTNGRTWAVGPLVAAAGSKTGSCTFSGSAVRGAQVTVSWTDNSTSVTATRSSWSAGATVYQASAKLFDNTGASYGYTGLVRVSDRETGSLSHSYFGYAPKSKSPYVRVVLYGSGLVSGQTCTARVRIP